MVWQDYIIEYDRITLVKREIEKARNHYFKVADKFRPKKNDTQDDFRFAFYLGKADALTDLLKMFEPLEI